jgi:hypothetical protein
LDLVVGIFSTPELASEAIGAMDALDGEHEWHTLMDDHGCRLESEGRRCGYPLPRPAGDPRRHGLPAMIWLTLIAALLLVNLRIWAMCRVAAADDRANGRTDA